MKAQGISPKKKKKQHAAPPNALKKLKTGISSLFDKLESAHSSLLAKAAAQTVEQQLRRSQVRLLITLPC
jgi:hypothetical protein